MKYQELYFRHLPHYQPPGATLFITFRLAESLPKDLLDHLITESKRLETEIEQIPDLNQRKQSLQALYKKSFAKWDSCLDAVKSGPTWLAQPDIAKIVISEIKMNAGIQYELAAYCIMPNHVHMVITPLRTEDSYFPISRIMQMIKGRTARKANLILGRQGQFWQHESYDHVVHDNAELERVIHYVINNPVRAGLPAQWSYSRY